MHGQPSSLSPSKAVHDQGMRSLIKRIDDLPVIPPVAIQALTKSMNDEVDLNELGKIIESDPVLTARVLRMVNNVQSGYRNKINTTKQAIALAGLHQVKIALLGVMFRDYLADPKSELYIQSRQLWSHSLLAALIAEIISRKTYPSLQEKAFVAALLHDIGKMVIIDIFPESHQKIEDLKQKRKLHVIEAEQEVLDTDHCIIGKLLATRWDLPKYIVDSIWLHHQLSPEDTPGNSKELLNIVLKSNELAHEIFCDYQPMAYELMRQGQGWPDLGLDAQEMDAIKQEATRNFSRMAEFFDLESDLNSIFHQTVKKANKKLSTLGLELNIKNKRLEKYQKVLTLNQNLSIRLTNLMDKQAVLKEAASSLSQFDPVRTGFFYIVEPSTRELEGVVWRDDGRARNLLCFLDRNCFPVWEHDDQKIPDNLKKILSKYKDRKESTETCSYSMNSKFHIFSFQIQENIFVELGIFLKPDWHNLHEQEYKLFFQTARILSSSLEKAISYEYLDKTTEELTQALWKNRKMKLQHLQTERLAAVGQLAAGAAHEINNPLAIISARAQLLQLKEEDGKKQKELSLIAQQIDRISKILSNLIDFARPTPPELREIDVHKIIDKVLDLLGSELQKFNIKTNRKYAPDLKTIKADPGQLEQVILNLLINAQHAMEKQGGTLTLSTEHSRDFRSVTITIQDEGEGISSANLKKIFDPFYTTKEEGKGTGLGLSTSYGIINNHFGEMYMTSEPGKGTRVKIVLPVDIDQLKPAPTTQPPSSVKDDEALPRIMVVDDEEHIRDILKETLENENMTVDTADNGEKGLNKLYKNSYDLLLLDIKMPLRDGLSLLREIRTINQHLPVIVITGMASHEEMQEALGHGNCHCMRKPFHIKTLLSYINDFLNKN